MRKPYRHIDLEDKFSDFEFSPDDSNWNKISESIDEASSKGSLKKKFHDYTLTPSASVWSAVSSDLHPRRKRRIAAYWWTGAAASIILLLLFVPLNSKNESLSDSNYLPREASGLASLPLSNLSSKELTPHEKLSDIAIFLGDQSFIKDQHKNANKTSNTEVVSRSINHAQVYSVSQKDLANNIVDSTVIMVVKKEKPTNPNLGYNDIAIEPMSGFLDEIELKGIAGEFTFPELSSRRHRQRELLALNQVGSGASNSSSAFLFNGITQDDESSIVTEFSGESLSSSNEDFNTPIYFTINLESSMSNGYKDRLRLGFGLGALIVNSSRISDSGNFRTETATSRRYIAIPVYLKYNFIDKRKLDFYTSLGVISELGFGAKKVVSDYEFDQLIDMTSSKFSLGLGQINTSFGLGSNFKITNHLGGFLEGSLAYYFIESSETIWSSKSLWPSIKSGLTIKF